MDVTGTATGGSTTTLSNSGLTAPDGTYIGYQVSVPSDSGYTGTVTGYVASTHTVTFTPAAGASPSGDAYTLTPVALVSSTGYAADNVQTVTVPGSFSSTYTLTFNGHTTGSIAYNASAATVRWSDEARKGIHGTTMHVYNNTGPISGLPAFARTPQWRGPTTDADPDYPGIGPLDRLYSNPIKPSDYGSLPNDPAQLSPLPNGPIQRQP